MRTLLVIVAVAGLVVLVYAVASPGLGNAAGSGSGLAIPSDADPAGVLAQAKAASDAAIRATAPASGAEGVLVTKPGGFTGRCQDRGTVGEALLAILEKTHGQDIRTMDRSFAFEYHKILSAWREDPARKEADVALLLEAWTTIPDSSFRWALSWLFERSADDRFVEPLTEVAKIDPWRAVDALGNVGSARAIERLIEVAAELERPEVRAQARIRVARSGYEGAVDHLLAAIRDPRASDLEKVAAVEALSLVPNDPAAVAKAMELALGPPVVVRDLGERRMDHEIADLRSAAILAVMKQGDQDRVRRLLDVADQMGADEAFVRMVDTHLGGYQGADLSRVVFERIGRRGKASIGEARYLNAASTRSDVEHLKSIAHLGEDDATRELLQAAALNAAKRE